MSHQDDTGTQSDTIKRLEKELRDSKNRCEQLQKAMKYSPTGRSLLSKFIQATQDIHEAREEIKLLKAIMDMMKDRANE
jgi:predicted RNase H-like nuclease (RuvC/YqgF family)